MITSNIQELFDGLLPDEQAAELFHSLSVSPERRADFQRHVALQGAMRDDRFDSRLTSDEDAAIWGTISGLSLATTGATSGVVAGWIIKPVLFVLAGVVGYILGTTTFSSSSGDAEGSRTARTSAPAPTYVVKVPNVLVVPVPVAGPVRTVTVAARAPRSTRVPSTTAALAVNDNASHATSTLDHALGADGRLTTPPNQTSTAHSDGAIQQNALGTTTHDSSNANHGNSTAPAQPLADSSTANGQNIARSNTPKALSPEEVEPLLHSRTDETLPNDAGDKCGAFHTGGFEFGFSQMLSATTRTAADTGTSSTPLLWNNAVDLSYRFLDGMLGVGGRVGYGGMRMTKQVQKSTPAGEQHSLNDLTPMEVQLDTATETRQLMVFELFANCRLPLSRSFAVTFEGAVGASASHSQAGGNVALLFFPSDRIAIQVGGGVSRYWYGNSVSDPVAQLRDAPDNTSVSNYRSSFSGFLLEGKYGLLLRF